MREMGIDCENLVKSLLTRVVQMIKIRTPAISFSLLHMNAEHVRMLRDQESNAETKVDPKPARIVQAPQLVAVSANVGFAHGRRIIRSQVFDE